MMHGPSFWFDARIYLIVVAGLLLVIGFYNPYAGALGIIVVLAMYKYSSERQADRQSMLNEYLSAISSQTDKIFNKAVQNLPLSIVVIDKEGLVYSRNDVFANWVKSSVNRGEPLLKYFPDMEFDKIISKLWAIGEDGCFDLKAPSGNYKIAYKFIEVEDIPILINNPTIDSAEKPQSPNNKLMVLYISNVTDIETIKAECHNSRPVMAYIQIDNYDDALKGLTENQRTSILAEVNRLLTEWIGGLDGFLKKIYEETYVAVLNRQALDKLIASEKFDILDKVRSIHGGNKIPITLSMGIAAGAPGVASLGNSAQGALDLALGRGGDQATVDIDDKFQFFGGKAKATEKNTKVRARIVAQNLRELIEQADAALVMGHSDEDFDSLGASMGVARMVRQLGKPVYIVISKPGAAIDKLSELLLDYEQYLNTFISPARAQSLVDDKTLLFIVDVHRPELVAAPEIISKTERRVVIDHHRRAETFIDHPTLVYLEPSSSSASELVTELLSYFSDKVELTQMEASTLYAGIVLDTKNFSVQTGVRTFEAASYLRRAGADPGLVKQMFKMDLDSLKVRAAIIESTEMPFESVAVSVCTHAKNNNKSKVIIAQAADMLLSIESIKASFVLHLAEDEDTVNVSARSQGDINVQVIMEKLGGGGHQLAAGAQIKGKSVGEVKADIIALVSNYIQESEHQDESDFGARG